MGDDDDGRGERERAAIVEELAAVRAESAERWAAIQRLAPAAKGLRMRAQRQAAALTALRAHLETLPRPAGDDALDAWVETARHLLDAAHIE